MISKISISRIFSVLFIIIFTLATPALAAPGDTIRISVNSSGVQADFSSYFSTISADGRYVAFESEASNLVDGDTANRDIFVRDTVNNVTVCASVNSSGKPGGGDGNISISADGRYVAFSSMSSLLSEDKNPYRDVYVRDIVDNITTLISVPLAGQQAADWASQHPAISADGRYVAFEGWASNLVIGDTNKTYDVFVRDLAAKTTTRVSVSSNGVEANSFSWGIPSISADGRYVAFWSDASNLVSGDINGHDDVFLRDTVLNTTTLVSVASDGTQGNMTTYTFTFTSISADGRYIAFNSPSTNLVSGDTNGLRDVFVRDTISNTTTRASVGSGGIQANDSSLYFSISADGRYLAFDSSATNLGTPDTNYFHKNIFVHDIVANITTLVSVDSNKNLGYGASEFPSISGHGGRVTFMSWADNLVNGDTNTRADIFMHEPSWSTSTFADVPTTYWAYNYIERLYNAGITSGCSTNPLIYCPESTVTRAQMAIFILRGIHGSAYTPPTATGTVFTDVPANAFAADWIEQLATEGVTSGCGNGNYCPDATITRAQMAIFLLRGEHGSTYVPPTATGTVFGDIPLGSFADAWIEQLALEGVTSGCGGGNYCPDNSVTRAEMAVFLVRAFGLP